MAPEQMRSARDVDVRVDIWAVGAILFELVTGRQVFPGSTLPEICASVLDPRDVRVSELQAALPPGLAAAIDRALAKDRALRFKDVGELAVALAPYGSHKAQESRERIERGLTGKEFGAPRLAKDPTGRYVLGPNPRSTSKAGLSGSQSGAVASSEALTERPPGSSRSRTLALVFAVAAVACAVAAVLATNRVPLTASTAIPVAQDAPSRSRAPAAAAKPDPMAAPQPIDTESEPAARGASAPSVKAPAPAKAPPRHPYAGPTRPVATAPAASAPAPSASARSKKASLADAWDTSSFGPRY
jgi:eukaryotic-like serine/threonine-protein kinase